LLKIGYQLKQVRERLAKGLVDKGVLRTEKRNFLLFDMATHPLSDPGIKLEVVHRVVDCLLGRGGAPSRRTIALVCAAYAANVLENALTIAQLSHAQRESCFNRGEEMLAVWSTLGLPDDAAVNRTAGAAAKTQQEKEKIGWTEVMCGVISVFMKMDGML
jgi:Golgi phosphoprotein 3